MQLILPLFPREAKLINEQVGVHEHDGLVQYIVNGLPVYGHSKHDLNAFRFITSNFIHQGLCRKVDIERCFGISEDTVSRAYKKFVTQGDYTGALCTGIISDGRTYRKTSGGY